MVIKKFLSIFLIVLLCGLLLVGCGEESADGEPPDGEPPEEEPPSEEPATLPDGLAFQMIEGTNEVEIYCISGVKSLSGRVILPSYCGTFPVTRIKEWTFQACDKIEEIVLPRFLTEIGQQAFAHCTALKRVDFSPALQAIRYGAFEECTALEQIDLPNGLETIERIAFQECSALEPVLVIPPSVKKIELWAFSKSGVRSVILPESVGNINRKAFEHADIYTDAEGRQAEWWTVGSGFMSYGNTYTNIFYGTVFDHDGNVPYVRSVKGVDYVNTGETVAVTGDEYLVRPYFLPVREGYVFRGWSTEEGGEVEFPTRMYDSTVDTWERHLSLEGYYDRNGDEAYMTVLGRKSDFDRITPYMPLYAVWEPI